jgi:multiple sugar transport system substrate-binding protein
MATRSRTARSRSFVVIVAVGLMLAACGGGASPSPATPGGSPGASVGASSGTSPGASASGAADAGAVTMISSQLVPVEEGEKMRNKILADFSGQVEFIGAEAGPFNDQIRAQGEAGSGEISVIGGLHGEFSAFGAAGLLTDLSDIVADLGDVNPDYVELGKLGGDQQLYAPWMQATYIMAARQEAVQYLPTGADINALTWDQIREWGANIQAATGERKLGFPAGEDGLWHRFFQGYAYPSFTGGLNTTFAGSDAVAMWTWLKDTWKYVNPQSTTYGFMQEPLQSGEVWVAWDHTSRLIEALRNKPGEVVAFPAPAGPKGRGFMPVVAGLAIPKAAPNAEGGKALIKYLLQPDTQAKTLTEVSFFPVVTADLPGELDPGTKAEQDAVAAMTGASDALPSILPVGLGDQGGAYNQVFRDAFQQIVLDGQDPAGVLATQKANLQAVLDGVKAACWQPDPKGDGTCQVQ